MSGVVRDFLGSLRHGFVPPVGAPALVVGTPPGQQHELGALMAAVMAATEGWGVYYLGASLPVDELGHAVVKTGARALALSIVFPVDDPYLVRAMEDLRRYLPEGTSIFVGGHGAKEHAALFERVGAHVVTDFSTFRDVLRSLHR